MEYDTIKNRISGWLDANPKLLPVLFNILDLLFLRTWYIHRALQSANLKSGSKLLDAGTGFGQYAWHTVRTYTGVAVTVTDIKKEYLERAERCFEAFGLLDQIKLRVDDLTDTKIQDTFDCILVVDVLEHIEEDDAAIQHFSKQLRQGGYLIISTPSDHGGSDVHTRDQKSFIGEHVRSGYNLSELCEKLRQAGLEITKAEYSYGTWGSIAWRLLVKVPIQLLGKSFLFAPLVAMYYIPMLPLGLLLNLADLYHENKSGTGLIIIAHQTARSK